MANWIFCCGMIRSGSTLQYQIVKDIVEQKKIGVGIGYYEGEDLIVEIEKRQSYSGICIVKCHNYIPYLKQLDNANNYFIYSYRDIRDIVVSIMKKDGIPFDSVFNYQFRNKFLYNYNAWTSLNHIHISEYDDLFSNLNNEVYRIFTFLNMHLEKNEIRELTEKYSIEKQKERISKFHKSDFVLNQKNQYSREHLLHINHINSGKTNQWVNELTNYQIHQIQKYLGEWIRLNNYHLKRTIYSNYLIFKLVNLVFKIRQNGFLDSLKIYYKKLSKRRINQLNTKWDEFYNSQQQYVIKKIGKRLKIKLYKDSILSKYIFTESFEKKEIAFLRKHLKKGMTFLDIGANIGLFTLIASSIVKKSGKVIAFEPVGETFSRLKENISINNVKNCILEKIALSNTRGEQEIVISLDGYDAWNSLARPSNGKRFTSEKIITTTLDEYVIQLNEDIDFIKIDVEGWELNVLNGGKEYLQKKSPMLMIEFTDQNLLNAGYSSKELFQSILDLGYKLYSINDNLSLKEEIIKDNYPYENLIAIKC